MDEKTQQILDGLKHNPLAWGHLFCPEHFRDKSADFHLKLTVESMKNRYFAVASPRESAKSTVLTFLRTCHGVFYKMFRFIVICQNTFAKASGSLDAVKEEYRHNQRLIEACLINIERDATGDSIFTHPDGFKTRVLCKGMEQIGSVRGEKFGAYRPDLIIIDDLEDDVMVKNPQLRKSLESQFNEALIPAGQKDVCQYLAIGTILHDDSLMSKLVNKDYYPEWRKLLFRARYNDRNTGEKRSLWPEKWSVEDLNQMEKIKPTVFAKEYQNDPVSGLAGSFDSVDFRRWTVEEGQYVLYNDNGSVYTRGKLSDCKAAIACDLAWEDKRRDDSTVIMPGFLTPQDDLLIDNYIHEKGMRPHKIEEIIFQMEKRLKDITGKTVYIGFEKAKLEKVIKHLLKRAMRERQHYLVFKDLVWDLDKTQRIITRLEPRYKQHVIFHKAGMGDLEHQIIRIPDGAHDDLADAAQGLVQLLQYAPKKVSNKAPVDDPRFEKLRNDVLARKKRKGAYIFGQKGKRAWGLPAKKGLW